MFEDYKCATIHPVFMMKFIFLDLPLYGSTKIEFMPAQAYCVVFCIFAALIGPFAGFLASGMKRAYSIKDFGTTFPGHGGFLDRFDCQTISVIFCGLLMSQFIFREEITIDSACQKFEFDLNQKERDFIL
jgi:phosphatidate cytidylyltransferase